MRSPAYRRRYVLFELEVDGLLLSRLELWPAGRDVPARGPHGETLTDLGAVENNGPRYKDDERSRNWISGCNLVWLDGECWLRPDGTRQISRWKPTKRKDNPCE